MTRVNVYVPHIGSSADRTIDPKSGIVGEPREDGRILAYFESNRYGAVNIRTWADRVWHAADRMMQRYPTIASGIFDRDDLLFVGTFDPVARTLDIGDSEKIASWLGSDWLDDAELALT